MSIKRISIAAISLAISTCLSAADVSDTLYPDNRIGSMCEDLFSSIYRPFTTIRKIKLATAFFVNPEVAEKSRIIYSYGLPDLVSQKKTDELWSGLKSGKIHLLVPTSPKQDSFASVSWLDLRSIQSACERFPLTPTFPQLRTTIDFENKETFRRSLGTLKFEIIKDIHVVAPEEMFSGTANSKLISWDPTETVPISVEMRIPQKPIQK